MRIVPLLLTALFLASCAQPVRPPAPPPAADAPMPEPTPLRFNVQAGMNDTWNAVGQILVRTPGVAYESRAQMLGLNAIRYRGDALLLLTRGVPISDTVRTLTTEVSVTTTKGASMHSEAAAELLALLARELPAEIERVKAGLAAQEKAKQAKARKKKKARR